MRAPLLSMLLLAAVSSLGCSDPEPVVVTMNWARPLGGGINLEAHVTRTTDGFVLVGDYATEFDDSVTSDDSVDVTWFDGSSNVTAMTHVFGPDGGFSVSAANADGRVAVVTSNVYGGEPWQRDCSVFPDTEGSMAFTWLEPGGTCGASYVPDVRGFPVRAALSSDGKLIVMFYRGAPSYGGEVLVATEDGVQWRDEYPGDEVAVAVRPGDGSIAVAFQDGRDGVIVRYDADGTNIGEYRRDLWLVASMAFSSDGTLVAAGGGEPAELVALDDNHRVAWRMPMSDEGHGYPGSLSALPDGHLLLAFHPSGLSEAFGQAVDPTNVPSLWRLSETGEEVRVVVGDLPAVGSVAALDSGELVVVSGFRGEFRFGDEVFEGIDDTHRVGPTGAFLAGITLQP